MKNVRRFLAVAVAAAALVQPAAAAPNSRAAGKRVTSSEAFVQIETLNAPISRRNSFSGILMVGCGIDVPDPKLREKVLLLKPRLRDGLRVALSDYAYAYYKAGSAPDADTLATLLQGAVDQALGPGNGRLLLTHIMVQPGS